MPDPGGPHNHSTGDAQSGQRPTASKASRLASPTRKSLAPGAGQVVRIKEHPAEPITVDQALFQMERVGHDFYLFLDADTQLASVVYRRKGFDYGLLRLT